MSQARALRNKENLGLLREATSIAEFGQLKEQSLYRVNLEAYCVVQWPDLAPETPNPKAVVLKLVSKPKHHGFGSSSVLSRRSVD